MKNLSKTTQNADYIRIMQKRIQYYAEKYDPYEQYVRPLDKFSEEIPVKERRERISSVIQSFFLNIF